MRKLDLTKLLRPALTLIEYAFAILVIAVTMELFYGNTNKTWIIISISLFLSIFTSIIWLPSGVEKAERTPKVFNTTLRYNTYANHVVKQKLFDEVRAFCIKRNAEYEEELLSHKLAEYLLKTDNLSKYIELKQKALKTAIISSSGKIKQYTDKEFLDYCATFTKVQKKVLDYYSKHKIHYLRLTADDILKGHKTKGRLKPINTEKTKVAYRYVSKILWGVVLGVFTASLVFTKKDSWTINETIQVITWGFSLLLNIYTSINAGFKSVYEDRYNYYKEKNERCFEFFKYVDVDVNAIDNEIKSQLISDK